MKVNKLTLSIVMLSMIVSTIGLAYVTAQGDPPGDAFDRECEGQQADVMINESYEDLICYGEFYRLRQQVPEDILCVCFWYTDGRDSSLDYELFIINHHHRFR